MTVPQPQPLDDVPHDVLDAVVAASPLSEEEMAAHPAIPQIIAATYRAARARIAELEAAGRELVDTIDRADYGDASRAINHAADDFRAVLDASSAVRQADASRED